MRNKLEMLKHDYGCIHDWENSQLRDSQLGWTQNYGARCEMRNALIAIGKQLTANIIYGRIQLV